MVRRRRRTSCRPLLSDSGVLSGSPTAAGTANFVVQCKDAANETAIKPLTLLIQPALGIVSGTLPAAVAKTVYFHLFQASDGRPAFTGQSLMVHCPQASHSPMVVSSPAPRALLERIPLTIGLTDNTSPTPQTATAQITLAVIQPLTAVPQTFTAYTGATFSQSLTATGGTTPYTWTLASGALPPGLSLSGSTIAGTPTKAGQYPVVLNVADASGLTAAALYAFAVTEQLTIPLPSVPNGTNGLSYAAVLSAFGGTAPYTWTITSGSLPPGLTLSTTGIISGTPTATGSFPFTAVVTDSAAQTATKQYTLQIQPAPAGLTIPPASAALPVAVVGAAYVGSLTVTGGTAPYTWSLAPGASLPAGFTLNGAAVARHAHHCRNVHLRPDRQRRQRPHRHLRIRTYRWLWPRHHHHQHSHRYSGNRLLRDPHGRRRHSSLHMVWLASRSASRSAAPASSPEHLMPKAADPATIVVTDSSRPALSASKTFTVTSTQALVITTANPPQLTVGTAANITLQAQGGVSPYTWSVAGGVLPPGLTVSATGTVTGTPTKSGSYLVTVRVADSSAAPITATAQILLYCCGRAYHHHNHTPHCQHCPLLLRLAPGPRGHRPLFLVYRFRLTSKRSHSLGKRHHRLAFNSRHIDFRLEGL